MDTDDLLHLSQTCKRLYFLIRDEMRCGNLGIEVSLDFKHIQDSCQAFEEIAHNFPSVKKLSMQNCNNINGT